MQTPILQSKLAQTPWMSPHTWRLPGVQPLKSADWLVRDDAFAGQMALRDQLIEEKRKSVHDLLPEAQTAAEECLKLVLEALAADQGYTIKTDHIGRPDGAHVPLDRSAPLLTLGRLIQADMCLLQPLPDGHVLTGAILCFPEHWTLAEKIGRPMAAIHTPVPNYDENVARRVQRLFDAMSPERLLWRSNAFLRHSADLFTPLKEGETREDYPRDQALYIRSERQTFRKLPVSGAIVFGIHTSMVQITTLSDGERAGLESAGVKHI